MKLLLDTHAFIWWDTRVRLSGRALAACKDFNNTLHLSIVSVWELQIKTQLGKLALRLPLTDVLEDQRLKDGLIIEPIGVADIPGLADLPPLHRDPFDRLLIAQARRGGFHFIRDDPQVARYDVQILR